MNVMICSSIPPDHTTLGLPSASSSTVIVDVPLPESNCNLTQAVDVQMFTTRSSNSLCPKPSQEGESSEAPKPLHVDVLELRTTLASCFNLTYTLFGVNVLEPGAPTSGVLTVLMQGQGHTQGPERLTMSFGQSDAPMRTFLMCLTRRVQRHLSEGAGNRVLNQILTEMDGIHHIRRTREKIAWDEAAGEDAIKIEEDNAAEEEDPVPEITREQSRGFGNNFKFPEDETRLAPAETNAGNAGFTEDALDDDLYT
ncbi:hypothetical protein B0H16DRAFT_1861814 [Mycena metata]|uniref:Uncharacterized protein n=1 Tax=Mycena metata TaxID=1033252 RepID=A0AAD7IGX5_9AGAR|nr:hypothetical protein B0H16DRAFT_1861814 [Mycena metata]